MDGESLEKLGDDEIQIIETRIKNMNISPGIKVEPEDAEVEAAVASIMEQPALGCPRKSKTSQTDKFVWKPNIFPLFRSKV